MVATGEGTLSYRWQKGTTDLSDDGHYSGTTTATLTISNLDSRDKGDYRCRVAGLCETQYSTAASLSVISSDLDGDGDSDLEDFALFQACLGVVDPATTAPDCAKADVNGNGTVEPGADGAALRRCFSGPAIPLATGLLRAACPQTCGRDGTFKASPKPPSRNRTFAELLSFSSQAA